jgi:hypothetical protein
LTGCGEPVSPRRSWPRRDECGNPSRVAARWMWQFTPDFPVGSPNPSRGRARLARWIPESIAGVGARERSAGAMNVAIHRGPDRPPARLGSGVPEALVRHSRLGRTRIAILACPHPRGCVHHLDQLPAAQPAPAGIRPVTAARVSPRARPVDHGRPAPAPQPPPARSSPRMRTVPRTRSRPQAPTRIRRSTRPRRR